MTIPDNSADYTPEFTEEQEAMIDLIQGEDVYQSAMFLRKFKKVVDSFSNTDLRICFYGHLVNDVQPGSKLAEMIAEDCIVQAQQAAVEKNNFAALAGYMNAGLLGEYAPEEMAELCASIKTLILVTDMDQDPLLHLGTTALVLNNEADELWRKELAKDWKETYYRYDDRTRFNTSEFIATHLHNLPDTTYDCVTNDCAERIRYTLKNPPKKTDFSEDTDELEPLPVSDQFEMLTKLVSCFTPGSEEEAHWCREYYLLLINCERHDEIMPYAAIEMMEMCWDLEMESPCRKNLYDMCVTLESDHEYYEIKQNLQPENEKQINEKAAELATCDESQRIEALEAMSREAIEKGDEADTKLALTMERLLSLPWGLEEQKDATKQLQMKLALIDKFLDPKKQTPFVLSVMQNLQKRYELVGQICGDKNSITKSTADTADVPADIPANDLAQNFQFFSPGSGQISANLGFNAFNTLN